jgi:hypothetical protein
VDRGRLWQGSYSGWRREGKANWWKERTVLRERREKKNKWIEKGGSVRGGAGRWRLIEGGERSSEQTDRGGEISGEQTDRGGERRRKQRERGVKGEPMKGKTGIKNDCYCLESVKDCPRRVK